MKKRIFILLAVLLLGMVAGVFFVDTTPRVPLLAEIIGITNDSSGFPMIICHVTNVTAQPYVFEADVQRLSSGGWEERSILRSSRANYHGVAPYSLKHIEVWNWATSGVLRVSIHFGKDKTTRQHQIDSWLRNFNVGPIFGDSLGGYIFTSLTNFPAR